jgi:hypothetical protein
MNVSADEAVTIYARFCHAWYGGRAEQVARGRILHLRRKGDTKGVEVWEKLVRELKSSDQQTEAGRARTSSPPTAQRRRRRSPADLSAAPRR